MSYASRSIPLTDDPQWYRDAVVYEAHIRAFMDSNGDGVGDIRGLVKKLDYLQDLGVTAIWLLPFYPSPLRDGGYDIADYTSINPAYGTLDDFQHLLNEAHLRGLRVITELVINHTSNEHAWFQRARKAPPDSRWRNFYVWSDNPTRYRDARIIFKDFETSNWSWDPVAKAYYWHRFYHHQPDLNYDNEEVHEAVLGVVDFWFGMGVDGMRLDAVPYLYQREGTNCENLPETHAFLKKLRAHVDARFRNRLLLAEANQWPEDAVQYFGDGDECHMNFHFPLMPRMFMSVHMEDRFPIVDIMRQTPPVPEGCQWAIFLRNHDELTLEMVTDEDRDYMYRVYAEDPQARINLGIRRRLAPLLKLRSKIELLNGLLFSMPGTPVLYYGDEIGMGDNIYLGDRDGVRTPMQWSSDRNAGFSRANPQKLYLPVIIDPEYHYEAVNVETQQSNPTSLLWWTKRMIALRKQHQVFGRGDLTFLHPDNMKVLAFVRRFEGEAVLVVANLSRVAQYVELDVSSLAGFVPVEMFGHTPFPPFEPDRPYTLSLGPYGFYWFLLEPTTVEPARNEMAALPSAVVEETWERLLSGLGLNRLSALLGEWMQHRRWFRSKGRRVKRYQVIEITQIQTASGPACICFVRVDFAEGESETYIVPLAFATGDDTAWLEDEHPHARIAHLQIVSSPLGHSDDGTAEEGILYEATVSSEFVEALVHGIEHRHVFPGLAGNVETSAFRVPQDRALDVAARDSSGSVHSRLIGAEQTNTSIIYNEQMMLKLFRLLEPGTNPDLEIGRFLTERTDFRHVPPAMGALFFQPAEGQRSTLGVLQGFVENRGDAWQWTLDIVERFYENALACDHKVDELPSLRGSLLSRSRQELPDIAMEFIGPWLPMMALLGRRTAEMHAALASVADDPLFAPEEFSILTQRSLYQSAQARLKRTFDQLRKRLGRLGEHSHQLASLALAHEAQVDERLRTIFQRKVEAVRIRTHGDFHLGQVLYTGDDFIIIDFEGEPARSVGERRIKRSALRDVAGMLRSFHYAAVMGLRHGRVRPEDVQPLGPWARAWVDWVSRSYLAAWLDAADGQVFVPPSEELLHVLLEFHMLEKCIYEIGYELENRPHWLETPLHGLLEILGVDAPPGPPPQLSARESARIPSAESVLPPAPSESAEMPRPTVHPGDGQAVEGRSVPTGESKER